MDVMIFGTRVGRDPSVALVDEALRRRGVEPWFFETSRFPAELLLDYRCDGAVSGTIAGHRLDGVDAVWVRHFDPGDALPEGMDPSHRQASLDQAYAALWSVLDCMDAYVCDPPAPLLGSPRKPGLHQIGRAHV